MSPKFATLFLFVVLGFASVSSIPWIAEPRTGNWVTKHERLVNMTHEHATQVEVVFLGDSITEGWGGNGKAVWEKHYQNRHAFNYGIGGDRTEHVLWRMQHEELDKVNAKLVVLMIGTNNITHKDKAADIVKGIKTILDMLHQKMSHAKIILLSVFPRGGLQFDTEVHEINKLITKFDDKKRVFYLDVMPQFELGLDHVKQDLYVHDHLHLSPKGYQVWYETMEPLYSHLLKSN